MATYSIEWINEIKSVAEAYREGEHQRYLRLKAQQQAEVQAPARSNKLDRARAKSALTA